MRDDEFLDSLAAWLETSNAANLSARKLREIAELHRDLEQDIAKKEDDAEIVLSSLRRAKKAAAINAAEVENLRDTLRILEKRMKYRDKQIERLQEERRELKERLEHAIQQLARK